MKELQGKDISLLEGLELTSFKIQHTKTLSTALKVGTTHMDGAKIITLFSLAHNHKTQDAFNHFSHAYNNKAIFDPSN